MVWKVIGISAAVIIGLGAVIGSITWAVIATRGPSPPDLRPLDWWENTVIYQIYPRSFKDSDGDGIGDLAGITSELEHLVDAGVGAVWMSPIFVSPMVDFGYDISDFYNIHDEYGTMEDFIELVNKAHSLGLKVLLDYVPNHGSTESIYFQESAARTGRYDDFFVWADGRPDPENPTNPRGLLPSNWISQFGGSVWEWNEQRQQYYLHQFAIEQADFNFREPAVREEMINIMTYWMDLGADGFRVDAIPHLYEALPGEDGFYPDEPLTGNPYVEEGHPGYTTQEHVRDQMELYDVVYEWRQFVDDYQEEKGTDSKIMLAEAYANIYNTMLYYGDGTRIGAHFPFNFDFITDLSSYSNARDFVYTILRWLTYMPRGAVANWVFGNHDNNRMPSRFRDNMVDGLNSLNMILPGVAITYQGEEIGMRDGYVSWEDTKDVNALNRGDNETYMLYSRDPARTPYHWNSLTSAGFSTNTSTWLPVADDYQEINLERQIQDDRSHYKVYQALTALRREPALSHGAYDIRALSDNTLVLVRHLITHDTIALIFNVADQSDTVDLSDVPNLQEPMSVYTSSVHSTRTAGSGVALGEITLLPGEAIVLRANPTT